MDDDPRPHGTTVSAFASLSPTPPMAPVSLDNRSRLHAANPPHSSRWCRHSRAGSAH
ncbi:hypothetical protein ABZT34_31835 [Streptomyces sp. NPDC005329]|uniref:hypothetical protein n=1 Tax=Streptomyces sp. NPDC005329 TaxID=3157034 RepID=UPI0033A6FAD8